MDRPARRRHALLAAPPAIAGYQAAEIFDWRPFRKVGGVYRKHGPSKTAFEIENIRTVVGIVNAAHLKDQSKAGAQQDRR
jgi:hypothetical protein